MNPYLLFSNEFSLSEKADRIRCLWGFIHKITLTLEPYSCFGSVARVCIYYFLICSVACSSLPLLTHFPLLNSHVSLDVPGTPIQFSDRAKEMTVTRTPPPNYSHTLFFTIIPSGKTIKIVTVDY